MSNLGTTGKIFKQIPVITPGDVDGDDNHNIPAVFPASATAHISVNLIANVGIVTRNGSGRLTIVDTADQSRNIIH